MKKILSRIDSRHKVGVWVSDDTKKSYVYNQCLNWHSNLEYKIENLSSRDALYDFDNLEIAEILKARNRFLFFRDMLIDRISNNKELESYIDRKRTSLIKDSKEILQEIEESLDLILNHMTNQTNDLSTKEFRRNHACRTSNKLIALAILIQEMDCLEYIEGGIED